jgi:TRL-like protein family
VKRHRALRGCWAGVLVAATLPLGGCGMLYTNVSTPRAYRSATPGDVEAAASDPVVTGRSCARSVLFMVAWGDTGYAAATRDALRDHPDGLLYDVRSDMQVRAYALGAYTEVCTSVTGRVARP